MEKYLLIGGAIFGGLLLFGSGGSERGEIEAPRDETILDAAPASASSGRYSGQFTATRASDGHFYADAQINGRPVHMLIDTGASSVVLSRRDAQRIGIDVGKQGFTQRASTAGGEIAIMPVTLNMMSLGSLTERNIPAFVANGDLRVSLVGQSFLERVDSVEIAGGQIRLR
ncbi:MAG: TIGR02281 family clan AA aspartic protease [Sphingomonadaceae bacterium]|nr:TIGR02281 family clan AA aspartic protease [Sphingomonadaceae bacterium]